MTILVFFTFLLTVLPGKGWAQQKHYGRKCIDGGCTTGYDLDDLTGMIDGETAVVPSDSTYGGPLFYKYDEDSGEDENLPSIVDPDGAGNGRWILQNLPIPAGGTGATTGPEAVASIGAQPQDSELDELAAISGWAEGDLLRYSSSTLTRFAIGNNGEVLMVSSGTPSWSNTMNVSYITLPNANEPTTAAEGRIAHDNNDACIEVRDSVGSRLYACRDKPLVATIVDPDGQAVSTFPLWPIEDDYYPHGIIITDCGLKLDDNTVTYTVTLKDYSSPSDGSPTTIEAITCTNVYECEDNGTIDSGTISAGSIIYATVDSEDIDYLQIWCSAYIVEGN